SGAADLLLRGVMGSVTEIVMYRVVYRCVAARIAILAALGVCAAAVPAAAEPTNVGQLTSREAILSWMLGYRTTPVPTELPELVHAAAKFGAFRDMDSAGVYIGFIAGVLVSNPAKAEALVV